MNGLLLKDFYTLGKQMKLFLILIIVFAVLPHFSMSAFAVMYSAMLPMTALAYDERSKWDTLASMMPYSNFQIVFSKYLLGYLLTVGAMLLSLIAQTAITLVQHAPIDWASVLSLLAVTCMAFLLLAIDLPFLFKLGVERGRLFFIILTVCVVMAGVTFSDQLVALLEERSSCCERFVFC